MSGIHRSVFILKFGDPSNILGAVEARNLEFVTEMDGSEY